MTATRCGLSRGLLGLKLGAIQVLRNADGVKFSGKKRYEGVRFNVISVTRGWVGVQFSGKKRYVALEWPLRPNKMILIPPG